MNVSDDEDSHTVVDDSFSQSSDDDSAIFKQKIGNLRFAPIETGDIVELTCIGEQNQLYIRSTKNDNNYEKLLKITNAMISKKHQPSFLQPLKNDDVVLVKYGADYSRAVVLDSEELSVQLVDIGVAMNAKSNEIFYMTSDFQCQDRMVTPVLLKLPKMSQEENAAVNNILNKWVHNRFTVQANGAIEPHLTVDLIHITNGQSLTHLCQSRISKVLKIDDIGSKKVDKSHDIDLTIIDNSHLRQGVISFVLSNDFQTFVEQSQLVTQFGESLANTEPYKPEWLEICLVFLPDDDGTIMWYRAQFQQELVNGIAQVGLIDFNIPAEVKMSDIRKLNDDLGFERMSFFGKIRCENNSLDLLDDNQFGVFDNVTSYLLEPVADSFGIYFDDSYFVEDENFEEEILALED